MRIMPGDLGIASRLRIARLAADYESAADAADHMGMGISSYTSNENGTRSISVEKLIFFANFFDVNIEWLATGKPPMRGRGHPSELNGLSAADQAQVRALIERLRATQAE